MTCGYLSLAELAYVYRLVCAMRNVPEERMFSGLANGARGVVEESGRLHSDHFREDASWPESTAKELDRLRSLEKELLATTGTAEDLVQSIRTEYLGRVERALAAARERTTGHGRFSERARPSDTHDPALRHLQAVEQRGLVAVAEGELELQSAEIARIVCTLRAMVDAARFGPHATKSNSEALGRTDAERKVGGPLGWFKRKQPRHGG